MWQVNCRLLCVALRGVSVTLSPPCRGSAAAHSFSWWILEFGWTLILLLFQHMLSYQNVQLLSPFSLSLFSFWKLPLLKNYFFLRNLAHSFSWWISEFGWPLVLLLLQQCSAIHDSFMNFRLFIQQIYEITSAICIHTVFSHVMQFF